MRIIKSKSKNDFQTENNSLSFSEYVKMHEVGGATGDLWAGYNKGADYQIEGDPSSMNPQKKKKSKKKK